MFLYKVEIQITEIIACEHILNVKLSETSLQNWRPKCAVGLGFLNIFLKKEIFLMPWSASKVSCI